MPKLWQFIWLFVRRLYSLFILLASDPFDVADRWFGLNYEPPFWLFWVLLTIAIGFALFMAIRDFKGKINQPEIVKIPKILTLMDKHLKRKVKSQVKDVRNKIFRDVKEVLKLNGVLASCLQSLGITETLPKPKTLHITKRYRDSIENRIPQEIREQMLDKDRSWELNLRIGGILDKRKYGLQIEDDIKI